MRNRCITTSCQILRDLWNDHIRLVYTDRIPDSKFQLFHNADIMHTGPAYRRAFQFYRFKNSYRIDQACSGRAPLNFQKFRITHLICPFKCHGISGKFSCSSKRFSIGNIVINAHWKWVWFLKHHSYPLTEQVHIHSFEDILSVQKDITIDAASFHQIIHSVQTF